MPKCIDLSRIIGVYNLDVAHEDETDAAFAWYAVQWRDIPERFPFDTDTMDPLLRTPSAIDELERRFRLIDPR